MAKEAALARAAGTPTTYNSAVTSSETRPPNSSGRAYPFAAEALAAVQEELGVTAREASYRLQGQPVYELEVPVWALPGSSLLVVCWFSASRVDVRLLPADTRLPVVAITFRDVTQIVVYPGVEVTFKREGTGFLFVTRDGIASVAD